MRSTVSKICLSEKCLSKLCAVHVTNSLFVQAFAASLWTVASNKVYPVVECQSSGTRLYDIWKFMVANFHTKVSQMFYDFLCFLKALIQSKNCCVALLGNFWNNWATLYFNIWSHWRARGKSSAPKNTRSQKSRHASFVIQMYFLSGLSLLLTFNNSA